MTVALTESDARCAAGSLYLLMCVMTVFQLIRNLHVAVVYLLAGTESEKLKMLQSRKTG